MKITSNDIDQLNKIINIFHFNSSISSKYGSLQHKVNQDIRFDNNLQNEILLYLKSKFNEDYTFVYREDYAYYSKQESAQTMLLIDIVKEGKSVILFNLKNLQLDFLYSFVGRDFNELEKFFANYNVANIPPYFRNRHLFALDNDSKLLLDYLNDKTGTKTKDIKLSDFKINYFYEFYDRIFADKSMEQMQELYLKVMKYNLTYRNTSEFASAAFQSNSKINFFLHNLFTLIIFKRPLVDFDNLLSNHKEELRSKTVLNFVAKLNPKIMPDIVERLNYYIEDSKSLKNIKIVLQEEVRCQKIFKIDMNQFLAKYQWKMTGTKELLTNCLSVAAQTLNLNYHILENSRDTQFFNILCLGAAEKLHFYEEVILELINNESMLGSDFTTIGNFIKTKEEKQKLLDTIEEKQVKSKSYKL